MRRKTYMQISFQSVPDCSLYSKHKVATLKRHHFETVRSMLLINKTIPAKVSFWLKQKCYLYFMENLVKLNWDLGDTTFLYITWKLATYLLFEKAFAIYVLYSIIFGKYNTVTEKN